MLNNIAEDHESHFQGSETPDNMTVASEAFADDYIDQSQYTGSRKRKRAGDDVMSLADEKHQIWAEELFDYFMLLENPLDSSDQPPLPPDGINLDRPIDDKGHTALHWAAAMGDLTVVKTLIGRNASLDCLSRNGETPLIRAVIFTNCFDKKTMERLAGWLIPTVGFTDWFGSTVFHHIASSTSSKSKYACARYYLDAVLNKMAEVLSPVEIEKILNIQDRNGDTAITIAARNGARKCVRSLIGRNAAVDIANDMGETADELIVQLNHRRRDSRHLQSSRQQLSSSPFQLDPHIASNSFSHIQRLNNNNTNNSNGQSLLSSATKPSNSLMRDSSPNLFSMVEPIPFPHPHSLTTNHSPSHPIDPSSMPPPLHPSLSLSSFQTMPSESTSFLNTQLLPLLTSKSTKLAAAYDAQLSEKTLEISDLERAVKARREEVEGLKRAIRELVVRNEQLDHSSNGVEEEDLASRLDDGIRKCEEKREELQIEEVKSLLSSLQDHNEDDDEEEEEDEKEKDLIAKIETLQHDRVALVKDIVQNTSLAGLVDKQGDYRRLITGALGIKDDGDIEGMLKEICAELEEAAGVRSGVSNVHTNGNHSGGTGNSQQGTTTNATHTLIPV